MLLTRFCIRIPRCGVYDSHLIVFVDNNNRYVEEEKKKQSFVNSVLKFIARVQSNRVEKMRKLSMKGKRGKSETSSDRGSDGDSEENGVGVKNPADDAPDEDETPKPEKKTKKGRKSQQESSKDTETTEETTNEHENGTPAKKRKKEVTKPSTSEVKPADDEEEYEVSNERFIQPVFGFNDG